MLWQGAKTTKVGRAARGQQPGVGSDEPAAEIGDDGLAPVEIEGRPCSTVRRAKAPLPCWLRGSMPRILQGFGGLCHAQTVKTRG